MSKQRLSRRTFIRHVGVAGLTIPVVMPRLARAQSANEKLQVAFVATGGRAGGHVNDINNLEKKDNFPITCTAYTEVDIGRQKNAAGNWPGAKAYQDYRQMFEKSGKDFDAVVIATPDHHHFPAAAIALQQGKHVYCEKPLTWGVWEARKLEEMAAKAKVATQMGNQGHAGQGWRIVVAWINEGAIGDVKEVHTWTNRPVWPQGHTVSAGEDPIPDGLDWDNWIGPAAMRPYKKDVYHPFKWRGFFDFGAGALGDMACHTMDGTFWALNPGSPTSFELVKTSGHNGDTFPNETIVKWDFPARNGRPGFTQFWYDGTPDRKNKPAKPEGVDQAEWDKIHSGNLFIGTKGTLRVWGDYGNSPRLLGDLMEKVGNPKNVMESSPGHMKEFVLAARGDKPVDFPKSNFAYAAPFTETILLGVVAQRMNKPGEQYKFDGKNLKITNNPKADELLYREPRNGWKVVSR